MTEPRSLLGGVPGSDWSGICRAGGVAALLLVAYCLGTMVQLALLGGPPATATEAFALLQRSRVLGLLRLDLPTLLALPLYYILFLGLFATLRQVDFPAALLATLFVVVGVTLTLATPGALSLLALSDQHRAAATPEVRAHLEAAAEAILAADVWHGTGARIGGVLALVGGVVICLVMLRGAQFGRVTAFLGLGIHTLDLAHVFVGPVLPVAGMALMAVAGTLYPIWFYAVGRQMLRLAAVGAAANAPAAAATRERRPPSS